MEIPRSTYPGDFVGSFANNDWLEPRFAGLAFEQFQQIFFSDVAVERDDLYVLDGAGCR